jgi:hypothetical protein
MPRSREAAAGAPGRLGRQVPPLYVLDDSKLDRRLLGTRAMIELTTLDDGASFSRRRGLHGRIGGETP